MYPRYALPSSLVSRVALAVVTGRTRSFRRDAQSAVAHLRSLNRAPVQMLGGENLPAAGPCLLTMNHYYRPGFQAWWMALALSAAMPGEVHWVMTSAWTYTDPLGRLVYAPTMRWLLGRLARIYGFTPMPPDGAEVTDRAHAVRQVLTWTRQASAPVIGLAPEGRDMPGGRLAWPPAGAGRFILHLTNLGLKLVPIGIYEAEASLCLSVGQTYALDLAPNLPPDERDRQVSGQVMRRIAAQLPPHLRGDFG